MVPMTERQWAKIASCKIYPHLIFIVHNAAPQCGALDLCLPHLPLPLARFSVYMLVVMKGIRSIKTSTTYDQRLCSGSGTSGEEN